MCSITAGRIRSDDAAPALADQPAPGLSTNRGRLPNQLPPAPQGSEPSLLKILYTRTLRRLSSLPLAIAEMFLIAGLSAVGTVIEQNKPIQFYIDNYPDADQKARCHIYIFYQVTCGPVDSCPHKHLAPRCKVTSDLQFRVGPQVLGFLTYDIIFKLHLDQIYTAPYFLWLMALLGASLAACTSTRYAFGEVAALLTV